MCTVMHTYKMVSIVRRPLALVLGVHFIKESCVWHEHTIVGRTLDKHPPFVQGGWFDLGRPACTNDTTSLCPGEHVPRHLGERVRGEGGKHLPGGKEGV